MITYSEFLASIPRVKEALKLCRENEFRRAKWQLKEMSSLHKHITTKVNCWKVNTDK